MGTMQYKLISYRILSDSTGFLREYEFNISRTPGLIESISDLLNGKRPERRQETYVGRYGWRKLPDFERVSAISELDNWLDQQAERIEYDRKHRRSETISMDPIIDIVGDAKIVLKKHGY